MEDNKEKTIQWLSVPQFGEWEEKGEVPDYSLNFSKIRETRKMNKRDTSRSSLGNDEEILNALKIVKSNDHQQHQVTEHQQHRVTEQNDQLIDPIPTTKKSYFSCFNFFVKA